MKFKVWDSLLEQFESESNLTEFTIGYNGQLWEIPTEHQAEKADSKYYPVFSTGRTDKNDVEIYDGDIIKNSNIIRIATLKAAKEECEYGELSIPNLYYYHNHIEIIGNKFENPELLT